MLKKIKLFLGFSLFEVLTVLAVVSLASVAGVKYYQNQKKNAVADLYGEKLYVLGHAAQEYINNSKTLHTQYWLEGTDAGRNPLVPVATLVDGNYITTISGVDWLKEANAGTDPQGQPYLPDNFSISQGIAPLVLALPNQDNEVSRVDDQAFVTTISFSSASVDSPYTIDIKAIPLFSQKGEEPPVLEATLTQRALNFANTFYTPQKGIPVIQYAFDYVPEIEQNQINEIKGMLNQEAAGLFMKVDGTTAMQGMLSFDPKEPRAINGLTTLVLIGKDSAINFANDQAIKTIKGVEIIEFNNDSSQSSMEGISRIEFKEGANWKGEQINFDPRINLAYPEIRNLYTLEFKNSTQTRIKDLRFISFSGTPNERFNGFRRSDYPIDAPGYPTRYSTTSTLRRKIGGNNSNFTTTNSPLSAAGSCFLTHIDFNDAVSGSESPQDQCVIDDQYANPDLVMSTNQNYVECKVSCISWLIP